jgi:hypothetical protein
VDDRTVMAFTGHEDLATVLRYLAPAGDQPMQAKISKTRVQWRWNLSHQSFNPFD